MKFRVELLPDAEANLDHIFAWLSEKSPQGATAWYRRWLQVIADLEERADSYPRAPEDSRHETTIQQVVFKTKHGKPYRALFAISNGTVFVFCIRGHGQDFVASENLNLPD